MNINRADDARWDGQGRVSVSGSPPRCLSALSRGSSTGIGPGLRGGDLPESFGPWLTVCERNRRFGDDGNWNSFLTELLSQADEAELIQLEASVDSTVHRANQHGTNLGRTTGDLSKCTNFLTQQRRNVIERYFEQFKQWRSIPTRYDKLDVTGNALFETQHESERAVAASPHAYPKPETAANDQPMLSPERQWLSGLPNKMSPSLSK